MLLDDLIQTFPDELDRHKLAAGDPTALVKLICLIAGKDAAYACMHTNGLQAEVQDPDLCALVALGKGLTLSTVENNQVLGILDELGKQVDEVKKVVDGIATTSTSIVDKIDTNGASCEAQFREVHTNFDGILSKIDSTSSLISDVKSDITSLSADLVESDKYVRSEFKDLRSGVSEVQQSSDYLGKSLSNLANAAGSRHDQIKTQLTKVLSSIQNMVPTIDTTQQSVSYFSSKLDSLESSLRLLSDKCVSSYNAWLHIVTSVSSEYTQFYADLSRVVNDGTVNKLDEFLRAIVNLESISQDISEQTSTLMRATSNVASIFEDKEDLANKIRDIHANILSAASISNICEILTTAKALLPAKETNKLA